MIKDELQKRRGDKKSLEMLWKSTSLSKSKN